MSAMSDDSLSPGKVPWTDTLKYMRKSQCTEVKFSSWKRVNLENDYAAFLKTWNFKEVGIHGVQRFSCRTGNELKKYL